jgi:serine protease Do
MQLVKWGALTGALVMAAGVGAALIPPAHAQDTRIRAARVPQAAQVVQLLGRGTQIGVTIDEVTADDASKETVGVRVEDVAKASPAEKAGIKAGDVIVEFDGERVRSVRQFRRVVQETADGRKVTAVVVRGGQRTTVSVTPERGDGTIRGDDFEWRPFEGRDFMLDIVPPVPPAPPKPAMPPDLPLRFFGGGGRLGISVETLTPQLRDYFGAKDGVLVKSVTDGSAAAKAGVKAGDVITAVNGNRVEDTSDVVRAIDRLNDDGEFTIDVVRDRKPMTLKGKLERRRSGVRTRTIV